jgi:hypothetical protein
LALRYLRKEAWRNYGKTALEDSAKVVAREHKAVALNHEGRAANPADAYGARYA